MKILVEPAPSLPLFADDLELVIAVEEESVPALYTDNGLPRPDRHLLLGLMQAVSIAVEERDPESVVFKNGWSATLQTGSKAAEIRPGLVIVRSKAGRFAVLAPEDYASSRRLARQAVRWFTRAIRLDVP